MSVMVFTFIHSCLHLLLKCFLGTYSVPDAVPGTEYPGVNKTDETSAVLKLTFLVEMQKQISQLVDK